MTINPQTVGWFAMYSFQHRKHWNRLSGEFNLAWKEKMQVRVDVDFLSPIKKSSTDAMMAAWSVVPQEGRENLKVALFFSILLMP